MLNEVITIKNSAPSSLMQEYFWSLVMAKTFLLSLLDFTLQIMPGNDEINGNFLSLEPKTKPDTGTVCKARMSGFVFFCFN